MRRSQIYNRAISVAKDFLTWAAFLTLTAGILGYIFSLFTTRAAWLQRHSAAFWMIGLTLVVVVLFLRWWHLSHRFTIQFHDNFSSDLSQNWDYTGPWIIADKNTLKVTGSDSGGITKVGANWENYTFTFQAKILNSCLGIVVRAQGLDNYYMLQLGRESLMPHRRMSMPVISGIDGGSARDDKTETPSLNIISRYLLAWSRGDTVQIGQQLNDWFNCRVVVRGESIKLFIDGELSYQEENFLKNPTGKVGFRNYGDECALVRSVKVTVEP